MSNEATTMDLDGEIDYLPRERQYRAQRSPDESVTTAVVILTAAATGEDVLSLPPLAEVIDVDALNNLFGTTTDDAQELPGSVTFEYADCTVTVSNDDEILLQPNDL